MERIVALTPAFLLFVLCFLGVRVHARKTA